jgi:hypothetical protein
MLLYVKHLLPETDPPARQIHMGAGCFIELVSIGMSKEGYRTEVDYFPQGDYEVKPFEIAKKPVAKITLAKMTAKRKTSFMILFIKEAPIADLIKVK